MSEDMVATGINESFPVAGCVAGDRLVVVKNPTTLTGGEIIFDKTIPVSKTFDGFVAISGSLSDE